MTAVLDSREYCDRLLGLPRPGAEKILAYYDARIGAIGVDPRYMLVPLDDHVTHRGDGVFETVKFSGGRLYLLDQHLARIRASAAAIFLEPPCPWEEIRNIAIDVAAAGKEPDGQMCILIGRGPGGFSIDPAECPRASLYMAAYRVAKRPESWFAAGVSGFRTSIPAKQPYLAKIKNTNYLPNMLMIREGKSRGADIPFCYDDQGFLAESAVANLCLVDRDGVLVAPELTHALAGTTMLRALELLRGVLPVATRNITEDDVFGAAEILLLGTGPDCVAVVAYEGRPIGAGRPGPVSERLRRLIAGDIQANGVPVPGLV